MELDFAMLAERAEATPQAVMHIYRGGMDFVSVSEFPSVYSFAIAIKFSGSPQANRSEIPHSLSLAVTRPNGARLDLGSKSTFQLTHAPGAPGQAIGSLRVFSITMEFSEAGNYLFHVVVDDIESKMLPLLVHRVAPLSDLD